MKKILFIILVSLGMQNVFASEKISLGKGFFHVREKEKVISLDKLSAKSFYNVICDIKVLNASKQPIRIELIVKTPTFMASFGQDFDDENAHPLSLTNIKTSNPRLSNLTLNAFKGKGTTNTIEYNCFAESTNAV